MMAMQEATRIVEEKLTLGTLSEMTGFPLDFIKKELFIETEELSLSELRSVVLKYLKTTDEQLINDE